MTALGLVGQLLDIMVPGQRPKRPEPRRDSWDLAFERAPVAAKITSGGQPDTPGLWIGEDPLSDVQAAEGANQWR
jgi:hypothetical protein